MREILFKAKRIDNGEWVQGGYVNKTDCYGMECDEHYIVDGTSTDTEGYGEHYRVYKNTICQYTGLTDKNGNKIWENDIVEVKKNKQHFISQIEWDFWCCGFMFQDTQYTSCGMDALTSNGCYGPYYEVIGNIFDNADLVKG